ncbi:MAG: hypothetical protein ACTSUE_14530 [Promethearchaeota archaeon]
MARSIPGFENRYHDKEIELDFDPIPTCKHCGRPMKVQSRSKPRKIVGLLENYTIIKVYRVCGNSMCKGCLENSFK